MINSKIIAVAVIVIIVAASLVVYLTSSGTVLLKIPAGTQFPGTKRIGLQVTGYAANVTLSAIGAWKANGPESFFMGPAILSGTPRGPLPSLRALNGIINLTIYDHPSSSIGRYHVLNGDYSGHTVIAYFGSHIYFWFFASSNSVVVTITKTPIVRKTANRASSFPVLEIIQILGTAEQSQQVTKVLYALIRCSSAAL